MYEEGEFHRRMMEQHEQSQRMSDDDRYYEERETQRNSHQNNTGSGSSGSGWGILILLGIIGFIFYKIYMFIKANWVSIVTILGLCIVCTIACIIIQNKTRRLGLKVLFTTFTILAAIGLIGTVLYSGPGETKAFYVNLYKKIPKLEQKMIIEPTTPIYAHVTSDKLNIRIGPSVSNEIVGQLSKDQRVEISDKSGQWWKIKSDNEV